MGGEGLNIRRREVEEKEEVNHQEVNHQEVEGKGNSREVEVGDICS